jgi:hypothetical protein
MKKGDRTNDLRTNVIRANVGMSNVDRTHDVGKIGIWPNVIPVKTWLVLYFFSGQGVPVRLFPT